MRHGGDTATTGPPVAAGSALSLRELTVEFASPLGPLRAVDSLDLDLAPAKTLALVGESGCGKTATALAVLGLINDPASDVRGEVRFGGVDIRRLNHRHVRRIRGAGISMVFQEPVSSLNPVFTVGSQIAAVIRAHRPEASRREAMARAVELLAEVGIPDAESRVHGYPHEWSGGMCQRAMIAMAIANNPRVVIADEPTTALDVTVQAQVLRVLRQAQADTGAAILLITHDLGVVAELADSVAVMYAGRVVETGDVDQIFHDPRHPYTRALLASLPRLDAAHELVAIPGQPPQLHRMPPGCAFHPRCSLAAGRLQCRTATPPLEPADTSGHRTACHFASERAPVAVRPPGRTADDRPSPSSEPGATDQAPLLAVEDLAVHFPIRAGAMGRTIGRLRAVDGVTFSITGGETLGLVGESGCGKSTTAHAIVRLVDPTAGRIVFNGRDLSRFSRRQLRDVRRGIQMVFQDPHASLNPKMKVGDIIAEPLRIHGTHRRKELWDRVHELLDVVGLAPLHAARFPHQFSGGQLQRVGIARALALEPQVLVLDEPVSSLDVSIQAQVLNLLRDLQRRLGLAYLFISHDLSVVRQMADRVAVMYLGRIVESATAERLYRFPEHPYTQSLLDAVPRPDPSMRGRGDRIVLSGDVPSPADPPSGCGFRTRCWRAEPRCAAEVPDLTARGGDGHWCACHFPTSAQEAGEGAVTHPGG